MTKTLEKAILIRLKKTRGTGKNAKTRIEPDDRGAFTVQFNPTSLRVTQQNNIDEGGATTLTQRRQNPSAQSATLNFDLEFDTAEETDDQGPVDVRTRTAIIRQFAEPSPDRPKEPPPLLKFVWGTFSFIGIVNQLTEEMDLFSPEGRPLRAKVTVAMKEVRLDIEAKVVGAGARTGDNATPPGKPNATSGAPGTPPAPNPDTAALAQLGESLQQLLARLDADPATWRAAMAGLDSPLSLPAGAQVQLTTGALAGLGLGATAGFAAGGSLRGTASLAGALGVSGGAGDGFSGSVSATAGFSGTVGESFAGGGSAAAGFVLAEGGGVAASSRTVAAAQVQASVAAARSAFEVPAIRASGQVTVVGQLAPPIDPRAQSFGRGIPLRRRVGISLS
jgi:Contractile injection system tube protein